MQVFANKLKTGDEITGYVDKAPSVPATGIVSNVKLKGLAWVKVSFKDDEPILLDPLCIVQVNRSE